MVPTSQSLLKGLNHMILYECVCDVLGRVLGTK